ncbi:MAG: pilus assembly protein TadG-related protein [Geminicoccaceae bacterium]
MPIGSRSGTLQVLRQLVEDRRGVVAAVTAMLVVPLVIGIGLAVDASRMFLVRARLAQAVDAAALAAGQAVDVDEVIADARRIFDVNYPPDYMGAAVDNLDVRFDEESGEVEIVARTAVPTLVMSLAQIDSLDVEARALVVREQTGLELALVLDTTGSMCQPCTKRDALKRAAKDLVDIVYGPNDTGEDLYVGIVPFSARVKIGTTRTAWLSAAAPSGWNGCVEQRTGTLAFDDSPPSAGKWPPSKKYQTWNSSRRRWETSSSPPPCAEQVLPLTASKATVKAKIDALSTGGTTRIDIGAAWGWRVLSERWQGVWGTAGLPLDDEAETAKAIVVMSDGENVVDSEYDGSTTVAQANANLLATCQAMRTAGYTVFTVAFQAPPAGETVLRNCAGTSANFFASPTAADLQRAFRQIAGRLSALRLAE